MTAIDEIPHDGYAAGGLDARRVTAARLRADGYTYTEIGRLLDRATSTIHQWVNDPDGSKLRARKSRYAGTCADCGEPCNVDGRRNATEQGKPATRCKRCSLEHQRGDHG